MDVKRIEADSRNLEQTETQKVHSENLSFEGECALEQAPQKVLKSPSLEIVKAQMTQSCAICSE